MALNNLAKKRKKCHEVEILTSETSAERCQTQIIVIINDNDVVHNEQRKKEHK